MEINPLDLVDTEDLIKEMLKRGSFIIAGYVKDNQIDELMCIHSGSITSVVGMGELVAAYVSRMKCEVCRFGVRNARQVCDVIMPRQNDDDDDDDDVDDDVDDVDDDDDVDEEMDYA